MEAMKNLVILLFLSFSISSIAQNKDSAAFFLQKGNEAKQGRLYMVAAQHYKKAVSFDAGNIEAQRGLGNVAVEMRRYPDAIQAFGEVAKSNPNDPEANENLANLYFW